MESLSTLFNRAQKLASTSEATSKRFDEVLELLQRCEQLVDSAALFSSNEDADDLHTEHLRYLLIPFLIAELHSGRSTTDKIARLGSAKAAVSQYTCFINSCARYGFLNPGLQRLYAAEGQGQQLDPGSKRTAKIEQAKRSKEIDRLLQQLEQLKTRDKATDEDGHDQQPVGGAAGWDEEDDRQLWSLQLEQAAIAASNAIPQLQQEIEICKLAAEMQQRQGTAAVAQRGSSSSMGADAASKAAMANRLRDIAGQLASSDRDRLRQQVFRPSHILPTLTIEQQGDIELRQAQEREIASAAAAARAAAAEAALTAEEREEIARRKAASWDEFKDDNPYGSGNSKLRPCAL